MKRIRFIIGWLFLLCCTPIGAQETDWSEVFGRDTMFIKTIVSKWASNPIRVTAANQKARIHDFAKAFCSQYTGYSPNTGMVDYLKKPGKYTWEEKHYYVDDAPSNGYIKCDRGGQFDYMTEICYWRRPNGHSLVGVLMQMGFEGEGTVNKYALLFYDYDPNTRTMTPDMKVYNTVKSIVKTHRGTPNFRLPQEGKDIEVYSAEWVGTEDEDFFFDDFQLKWTGNGFK